MQRRMAPEIENIAILIVISLVPAGQSACWQVSGNTGDAAISGPEYGQVGAFSGRARLILAVSEQL